MFYTSNVRTRHDFNLIIIAKEDENLLENLQTQDEIQSRFFHLRGK